MSRRILLIEDDPISQDVIRSLLVGQGHQVDVATDGFSALDRARAVRYDVALIDYHLPEMDGYALGRLLCEHRPSEGTAPILIGLTADRNGLAARRGSDAVFKAILSKPIKPADLFSAIDGLCAGASRDHAARPEDALEEPDAGRRATAALWRQHGMALRPRAFVCPPPTPEQAAALSLCFDLTGADDATMIVLLERHGINEAIRAARRAKAERLPLVGLSSDHGDICDMVFCVGNPESWRMLAALIAPAGVATASRTPAAPKAMAPQPPAPGPVSTSSRPAPAISAPPLLGEDLPPALPASTATNAGLDLRSLLLQGICAPLNALRARLEHEGAPSQDLPAALAALDDVMLMADAIADFVKVPARHEPRADVFAPAELAENTVAMIRNVQGPLSPRLRWRLDPHVPDRMRGDIHQLSQILMILLDDVAHLPGGGVATLDVVHAGAPSEALIFSISHEPAEETAAGQDADVTARLRTIRMATLDRLVTLIGGSLDATGSPHGALLRMTIPAVTEAAFADGSHCEVEGPCNVVMIDDGVASSPLLTLLLTRAGHHVCRVGDAEAAIFACQSARPDIVLFDVANAPPARARALSSLRAFRAIHSRIPMLVLVSALGATDRADLAALGATDVLVKPFLPEALALAMAKLRQLPGEPAVEADPHTDSLDHDVRNALRAALGDASVERLTGQLLGEIDSLTNAEDASGTSQDASRIVELSTCAAMLGLSELAKRCAAFDPKEYGAASPLIAGRAVRTALQRTQHALANQRRAA